MVGVVGSKSPVGPDWQNLSLKGHQRLRTQHHCQLHDAQKDCFAGLTGRGPVSKTARKLTSAG